MMRLERSMQARNSKDERYQPVAMPTDSEKTVKRRCTLIPDLTLQRAETKTTARSVILASADAALRHRLNQGLTNLRWTVREASGGAEAMAQVDAIRPEALLVDDWLPDLEASEFAGHMALLYPGMDVLRLDGAIDRGEVQSKSPRRNELLHAIRLAQEHCAPQPDAASASTAAVRFTPRAAPAPARVQPRPKLPLPEMVGESARMMELAELVRLVAPRKATVLLEGETGTGKELVAKAIYQLSARATKPFAVLNCAAIPESLLEAELFGHTRGAFTGAVQARTGRIEAAHGGTLFLDEIGEMPLALQAKMLRFLESGELQRVGDNEMLHVDVRVVAATHQDLESMAAKGSFRLDLYHRLAVFPIEVPALRDRLEDLPLLVEYFLDLMGHDMPRKTLSGCAMDKLAAHHWPGNVRELKHVLERAAILSGDDIEIRDTSTLLKQRS
jgi:transcriptional regulator with GAF, ATPase, and Fis domain